MDSLRQPYLWIRSVLPAAALCLSFAGFAADPPPALTGVRPLHGPIVRYVTLPGSLKANQQATLCAKVPGYLKSIAVDTGDRVESGQLLGEIEAPELLADQARFRAEVKVAATDATRMSGARAKAPDLVTPQAVDEATGRLEVARANLERTETLLAYSHLKAPFSGVVTARFVDPGAFIPAASAATAGSAVGGGAVITLMDFSTIRMQVRVPEIEAALTRVGQPVRVSVEGLPGRSFEGKVSRLSYALDDATRTMLVEADLPNPQLELRPGMYAQVKLGVEQHADALLLPVGALVMEKANAFVWISDAGHARKRAVKIGFNDGARVEILGGLEGGETVIVPGKTVLVDGQAVQVTEAP